MFEFGFILLISVISFTVTTAADVNCTQFPEKNTLLQCCSGQALIAEAQSICDSKLKDLGRRAEFCFGECVFNETGLASNGQILMDKAKSILTEKFKNAPEFIPVMEEALKKCDTKVKDNRKDDGEPRRPQRQMMCNPHAAWIAGCALKETFVNCPSSRWQNTEACNQAKQFFETCKPGRRGGGRPGRGRLESDNKRENVKSL